MSFIVITKEKYMQILLIIIILLIIATVYFRNQMILKNAYYDYMVKLADKNDKKYNLEITETKSKLDYMEQIAYSNPVTKLATLELFTNNVNSRFKKDPNSNHYIVVFNIHNMPVINKLYGNAEGDSILAFVAKTTKSLLNRQYILGHVSSNLFAILVTSISEKEILGLIGLITNNVKNYSDKYTVETSFGITKIEDIHMPMRELLNKAILAQKSITDIKSCNYYFFNATLNEQLIKNKKISEELEQTLLDHQFEMYLQPMVDLHTYKIESCEALVRWNHPEKGILSPYAFVPLLESNNLILKLDQYMWEESCKTIRHWIDNKIEPIPISVNMAPAHLESPTLIFSLNNLIDKYKIPKRYIILEIPERAFIPISPAIIEVVKNLAKEGYLLTIDNFGSQSSPISLMNDLPIKYVKFDRNFLSKNVENEGGLTILRYLIAMAKELDLDVVTEGVETIEQANFLTEIGCDIAQGYFFTKPVTLREFDQLSRGYVKKNFYPNEYYPTFADIEAQRV